jgi:hypothetical protein
MASLSVIERVFHIQKIVLAFKYSLQVKDSGSSEIWIHQQNIMFVSLQVLKLVMETSVKVKDILRMEVSTTCIYQNFIIVS